MCTATDQIDCVYVRIKMFYKLVGSVELHGGVLGYMVGVLGYMVGC